MAKPELDVLSSQLGFGSAAARLPMVDKAEAFDLALTAVSRPSFLPGKASVDKVAPLVTCAKWQDQVKLGLLCGGVVDVGELVQRDDKAIWTGRGHEVRAYPLVQGTGREDGALEVEVWLLEPPGTNDFPLHVTGYEGLDWCPQPALTPEEIADGHFRPEWCIDSFAIYHPTLRHYRRGGIDYGTGKLFHLHRLSVIDAAGVHTWGTYSWDGNGLLTAHVPPGFLESATYPVLLDPTIGYGTPGGSSYGSSSSHLTPDTLTEAGTLVNVQTYSESSFGGTVSVKGLVYANSGSLSSSTATTCLASGGAISFAATPSWRVFTFAASLSAQELLFGSVDNNAGGDRHKFYYDSNGSYQSQYVGDVNYTTPGNNPTFSGQYGGRFSITLEYTAGGGASGNPWHAYAQQ